MPAEPRALPRDCGRRARKRPCELSMAGSRLESREDVRRQLGTLQVVGDGERLFRKTMLPHDAVVPLHAVPISSGWRPACVLKAEPLPPLKLVRRTALSRTETRYESPLDFDGLNRPVHATAWGNPRAG